VLSTPITNHKDTPGPSFLEALLFPQIRKLPQRLKRHVSQVDYVKKSISHFNAPAPNTAILQFAIAQFRWHLANDKKVANAQKSLESCH
jgi:hypothetical protein